MERISYQGSPGRSQERPVLLKGTKGARLYRGAEAPFEGVGFLETGKKS